MGRFGLRAVFRIGGGKNRARQKHPTTAASGHVLGTFWYLCVRTGHTRRVAEREELGSNLLPWESPHFRRLGSAKPMKKPPFDWGKLLRPAPIRKHVKVVERKTTADGSSIEHRGKIPPASRIRDTPVTASNVRSLKHRPKSSSEPVNIKKVYAALRQHCTDPQILCRDINFWTHNHAAKLNDAETRMKLKWLNKK